MYTNHTHVVISYYNNVRPFIGFKTDVFPTQYVHGKHSTRFDIIYDIRIVPCVIYNAIFDTRNERVSFAFKNI